MMMMMVMRECSWSALSSCLCQPVMRKMRVSELRGKGSFTPWSVGSETELASGGARCLLDHSPSPVISVPVPVPRGRKKAKGGNVFEALIQDESEEEKEEEEEKPVLKPAKPEKNRINKVSGGSAGCASSWGYQFPTHKPPLLSLSCLCRRTHL